MGENGKMTAGKAGGGLRNGRRPKPWVLLLAVMLPLWGLWFYAYASLKNLVEGMDALPRFYGMHLYKEILQDRLEGAAAVLEAWEERLGEQTVAPYSSAPPLPAAGDVRFLVVDRREFRILYPTGPFENPRAAGFLVGKAGRGAFLQTLRRLVAGGAGSGYFCLDEEESPRGEGRRCWFLSAAAAGKNLICVAAVSEDRLREAGGSLERAQRVLLRERSRRFAAVTLPVLVLCSLLAGRLLLRDASGMAADPMTNRRCL